jgi:hypothetical protein
MRHGPISTFAKAVIRRGDGIAAGVEMNNNSPASDEKCKGALCGELSQLTDRFLIDQQNPY